jgi:hypothetical protein
LLCCALRRHCERSEAIQLVRVKIIGNMKNDVILTALVNFLVPIILLYAFFSLADYIYNGLFSVVYAAILFIIAFMIYAAKFGGLESYALISIKLISWVGVLISAIYLIFILLLLTKLMPHF